MSSLLRLRGAAIFWHSAQRQAMEAAARNPGQGLLQQQETPLKGKELIVWMWQNEYGNFKNASQNYTQVAIAALLSLQDEIYEHCDFIFDCEPF